jgi:IS5 family transposase
MSFSDFEYAGKRKQTRRERFLAEMDQVVPWSGLVALIEPHYPKAGGGRKPILWKPCCAFTCCRTGSL